MADEQTKPAPEVSEKPAPAVQSAAVPASQPKEAPKPPVEAAKPVPAPVAAQPAPAVTVPPPVEPAPKFVPVPEIRTEKGAEVKRPKEDIFKRGHATDLVDLKSPLRQAFNALVAKVQSVALAIKEGNPQNFPPLIVEGFGVRINDLPGQAHRILLESGPSVFVIIEGVGQGLQARYYAHIPAEVSNLVTPWLRELDIPISESVFIRPSSL